MQIKKWLFAFSCYISASSYAGTVQVGASLDSVTIIGPTAFGHQAGNMEIKVTNGLGSLTGVVCDSNYIATKNTVTNFKEMLSILLAAQLAQKPVILGITDDPSLTAFGGRCSLVSVGILK
jgi:hypothetical protein